ncbi:MAG: hypothetical protein HC851_03125 [Acaryochloris sp. RU_4_1]|nr:hypothetical protein [Acaryochloris sp. SU_5_25]NJM64715.1 hypothetical protein [Acaryochloris sp. RU_4_1]NJN37861.1 hypothetical protein [Acaryochloridaceae cyanobacterium CSU_3_4]NJR53936.1 hypothetical protein [Acaryochloris sp. CRU_2_0]
MIAPLFAACYCPPPLILLFTMYTLPFPVLILIVASLYLSAIHVLLRLLQNRNLFRRP